jgi:hypothetical protein
VASFCGTPCGEPDDSGPEPEEGTGAPVVTDRWIIGIDWAHGYPDRLHSLKARARTQRRLDRKSNVRRRKRHAEISRVWMFHPGGRRVKVRAGRERVSP